MSGRDATHKYFSINYHFLFNIFRYLQNVCSLHHVLGQFFFTSSEKKVDYYHQKVNVQVVSRVAERITTRVFRNQEVLRKFSKFLNLIASGQPVTKWQTSTFGLRNSRKISCKKLHSKIFFTQFPEFIYSPLSKIVT